MWCVVNSLISVMGVKHSIPSKLSCAGVMQELQTVAEQISEVQRDIQAWLLQLSD